MHILIVEDQFSLADAMKAALEKEKFTVAIAALSGVYDLIILDVMLPGKNGFEILHSVKSETDTPVIMVTAKGEIEDKLNGLEHGADDSGYTIDGTTLTITTAGTYRISGSCSEGAVIVGKGLSSVTLVLDNLTLASSTTAPIVVKKSATANIHLVGTSTLTDNEDPANETSTDTTIAEAFEGAAIKVKSGSKRYQGRRDCFAYL